LAAVVAADADATAAVVAALVIEVAAAIADDAVVVTGAAMSVAAMEAAVDIAVVSGVGTAGSIFSLLSPPQATAARIAKGTRARNFRLFMIVVLRDRIYSSVPSDHNRKATSALVSH
jgi:hypothetical protein